MASINKQKTNLLNRAERAFSPLRMVRYERRVLRRVGDELSTLNQEDGNVVFDEVATEFLSQSPELLRKSLLESNYSIDVRRYLEEFEKLTEIDLEFYRKKGLKVDEAKIFQLQKANIQNMINQLLKEGLNDLYITPVQNALHSAIVSGSSIKEIQKAIREAMRGRLQRYLPVITMDGLHQHDGSIAQEVINQFGFTEVEYIGTIIKTTRPQCRRWLGMETIKLEDLPSEIEWAETNGSGMVKGTNPKSFPTLRGGYNCRHFVIPKITSKKEREKTVIPPETLSTVVDEIESTGIRFDAFLDKRANRIEIGVIRVDEDSRGEGRMRSGVERLIEFADKTGRQITVTPTGEFGANKNRLIEFYKSMGFFLNEGENRDFTTKERMIRHPQK